MKLKLANLAPATIIALAVGVICLLVMAQEYFGSFGILQRLEWITFDWRARQAVSIDDRAHRRVRYQRHINQRDERRFDARTIDDRQSRDQ